MKKIIVLLFYCSLIYSQQGSNPQLIKIEHLYPQINEVKHILPADDGIRYFFTSDAIWIAQDSLNEISFLKRVPLAISDTFRTLLHQSLLIISQKDSLFCFDKSDKKNLTFIYKVKMPSNLSDIDDFGNHLIVKINNRHHLVLLTEDSLMIKKTYDIGNIEIDTDYPFIIFKESNKLYIYKMISDLSIYFVNIKSFNGNIEIAARDGKVFVSEIYIINTYNKEENLYSFKNIEGELIQIGYRTGMMMDNKYLITAYSSSLLALKPTTGINNEIRIFSDLCNLVYSYSMDTKVSISDSTVYAYSISLFINNKKYEIPNYISIPLKNKLILDKNKVIYAGELLSDNSINYEYPFHYTGNLIKADSFLLVQDNGSCKAIMLNQNGFFVCDSFFHAYLLNNTDYYKSFLVSHANRFEIFKRNQNNYQSIYSDNELTSALKSSYKYPFIYISDMSKGLYRFKYDGISVSGKIKVRYNPSGKYSRCVIYGSNLFVIENKKVLIYDISNLELTPLLTDSLTLEMINHLWEFVITESNVYLKGSVEDKTVISRLMKKNDKWELKYYFNLGYFLEPSNLVEDNKRVLIIGNGKAVWVKDTLAVLSQKDITHLIQIEDFRLEQNYPNPFNPSTKISYSIAKRSRVSLKIYDIMGREIETLIDKEQERGVYEVDYTPKNLSSGIYFYTLNAENYRETKKLIFLK